MISPAPLTAMLRKPPVAWVMLFASLAMLVLLSAPPARARRDEHMAPLLPRQELLRLFGRSQMPLVVDYFWLQTIQATGKAWSAEEYKDVYFYADMLTDLDPRFEYAYNFSAVVIPTNLGREKWVNTEESTRLLEKGLKQFPNNMELWVLYAYNLSFFHQRYREAADALTEASKRPGAPPYALALATRLYAQAGQVGAGLDLARSLADSAQDEETREFFKRRALELELEGILQKVDVAIQAYRQREGRAPETVEELVRKGDLPEMPADPLGGQLLIGFDGRTYSSSIRSRLETFRPENRL